MECLQTDSLKTHAGFLLERSALASHKRIALQMNAIFRFSFQFKVGTNVLQTALSYGAKAVKDGTVGRVLNR